MGCAVCEVRAEVDGRSVHVELNLKNLEKLAGSTERSCYLYRCRACGTFWELCAYDNEARELSLDEVRKYYPMVKVS
jgi:hypothetical protein